MRMLRMPSSNPNARRMVLLQVALHPAQSESVRMSKLAETDCHGSFCT